MSTQQLEESLETDLKNWAKRNLHVPVKKLETFNTSGSCEGIDLRNPSYDGGVHLQTISESVSAAGAHQDVSHRLERYEKMGRRIIATHYDSKKGIFGIYWRSE